MKMFRFLPPIIGNSVWAGSALVLFLSDHFHGLGVVQLKRCRCWCRYSITDSFVNLMEPGCHMIPSSLSQRALQYSVETSILSNTFLSSLLTRSAMIFLKSAYSLPGSDSDYLFTLFASYQDFHLKNLLLRFLKLDFSYSI